MAPGTSVLDAATLAAPVPPSALPGPDFIALLSRRRSIRRLRGGTLSDETLHRLREAVVRTPSAFGITPWHVVIIHERRDAFWQEVEAGFREGLDGDRRQRYLDRLDGFRDGAAVILVYEDLAAYSTLRDGWTLSDEVATAFVQQGLGMVQLAVWLALTAEGLVASLQHWEWLLQERLASFTGLDGTRYQLAATMPVGYPAESPRPGTPVQPDLPVSIDPVGVDAATG